MMDAKSFSDDSLREELKTLKQPLLLAFWAPWSNSCKTMEPILKELAHDYGKRLLVGFINVDENAHSPAEYGVTHLPGLSLFSTDGKQVISLTGPQPKSRLIEVIEKYFNL